MHQQPQKSQDFSAHIPERAKIGHFSDGQTDSTWHKGSMKQPYRLYYAPDNASLCIRLAMDHYLIPYETVLVDRSVAEQRSEEYLALNPNGKIPALLADDLVLFETEAILLWLAETHGCGLPRVDNPARNCALKWLFNFSNTLHPLMRNLFYPEALMQTDETKEALRAGSRAAILDHLDVLESAVGHEARFATISMLDFYLAPMLRWLAIYPSEHKGWYTLSDYPNLFALAARVEGLSSVKASANAEGLGANSFTAPKPPNPPEGSPT